jgi:hypothetical protein
MTMREIMNGGFQRDGQRGAALLELAILLPLLVVLAFGVIDLGRLIHARLIVANVSREGGSLASRDLQLGTTAGTTLIDMLLSSAKPFELSGSLGRIYVTKIKAGRTLNDPLPYIFSRDSGGSYGISSSIRGNVTRTPTGVPTSLYNRLIFEEAPQSASDIAEITVVEVFYFYRPITPLPNFVQNLFPDVDPLDVTKRGIQIGSRAIF